MWYIQCFTFLSAYGNRQYDAAARNPVIDARSAFERCLELNPHVPKVQARLDTLAQFAEDAINVPGDHKIERMVLCALVATADELVNTGDHDIKLNPIDAGPSHGVESIWDSETQAVGMSFDEWETTDEDIE